MRLDDRLVRLLLHYYVQSVTFYGDLPELKLDEEGKR
jgi:hypothetical protein